MHDHSLEVFPPLLERVLTRLDHVRKSNDQWTARCPAHADRTPSLSISLGKDGKVLLHCFAGCTYDAIVQALGLQVADMFPDTATAYPRQKNTAQQRLSLLDIAQAKKLPWKFLCNLGIVEEARGLRIPYYLADGTCASRYRIRTALTAKEGSWWNKGAGDITPYGLEHLEAARKDEFLIIVEGESDCWTLWYQGFPALGVPGAEMIQTLKVEYLAGMKRVYVLREPDAAGTRFVEGIARVLTTWNWQGTALMVTLPHAKDPNDLHQQDPKGFCAAFQQALDQAQPLYHREPAPLACAPEPAATPSNSSLMTLEELLAEPVTQTHWIIPELLPEGLLLLGGKPKQGKSWFALALALTIAAGGTLLDTYQAIQGEVLFLSLEDTEYRLQTRNRQLLSVVSPIPSGVTFATSWPRLDEGGVDQLEAYIQGHPQLRCIIIDTWAKIAPHMKGRTQYEDEYTALSLLKRLADTYHLSILVVHHLRKSQAHDVLDEVTGSTAMIGAVDAIMILKRERGEGQASLFLTGRDIEHERALALRFDHTTGWWQLDPQLEEPRAPKHTSARRMEGSPEA